MREGFGRAYLSVCFGAALAFAGVAGCHYDRDAFYEPVGAAGDTAVMELPLLPALPDEEVRDACEACAVEQCSAERDACLEDDACIAMLTCKSDCDDPACLERCDATNAFSIWYRDYFECVHAPATYGGKCSVECASGENWDCLGAYAFRDGLAEDYEVEFHFVENRRSNDPVRTNSFPVLEGTMVQTCDGALLEFCRPLDEATIGAYGKVTLKLSDRFEGFLRLTGGVTPEQALVYSAPCTGPQRRDVTFYSQSGRNSEVGVLEGIGFPIDGPDRTVVFAQQLDCLALPAPNVRFELRDGGAPDSAYLFGEFSDRTGTAGTGVLGIDFNVTGEVGTVEGRRFEGDEILSRRDIFVDLGWTTFVTVLPLEADQL